MGNGTAKGLKVVVPQGTRATFLVDRRAFVLGLPLHSTHQSCNGPGGVMLRASGKEIGRLPTQGAQQVSPELQDPKDPRRTNSQPENPGKPGILGEVHEVPGHNGPACPFNLAGAPRAPEIWGIRQEVSLSLTYGNQALPYVPSKVVEVVSYFLCLLLRSPISHFTANQLVFFVSKFLISSKKNGKRLDLDVNKGAIVFTATSVAVDFIKRPPKLFAVPQQLDS